MFNIRKGRYDPTPTTLKFVGNAEYLEHINRLMDEAEKRLLDCPFCGGHAVLEGGTYLADPATIATCTECKCRTLFRARGYYLVTGQHVTLEETIETAVATWNRRVQGRKEAQG